MPIRDFKCKECNNVFERIVKTDEHSVQCPECGAEAKSLLSAPAAFNFVGSGFYENDYKGKR